MPFVHLIHKVYFGAVGLWARGGRRRRWAGWIFAELEVSYGAWPTVCLVFFAPWPNRVVHRRSSFPKDRISGRTVPIGRRLSRRNGSVCSARRPLRSVGAHSDNRGIRSSGNRSSCASPWGSCPGGPERGIFHADRRGFQSLRLRKKFRQSRLGIRCPHCDCPV